MLGNSITTTAVIGQVSLDPPTVGKYSLNAKDSTAITPSALDTLRDTNIVMEGTKVVMSFTKLLTEAGEVNITTSGTNYFIAARGTGDWLGPNHTPHGSANMQPRIAKDFSDDATTPPSPPPSPTASLYLQQGRLFVFQTYYFLFLSIGRRSSDMSWDLLGCN